MNKRTIQSWDAKIKVRQDAVAKERDKLDEVIEEINGLRDSCDRAWDALQNARDALSELV
jgi:hypothetical protein